MTTLVVDAERHDLEVQDREPVSQPPKGATVIEAPSLIRVDGELVAAVASLGSQRHLGRMLAGPVDWRNKPNDRTSGARLGNSGLRTVPWEDGPRKAKSAARLGNSAVPWQGGIEGSQEARLAGFQPQFIAWGFSPPVPLRRRYGCAPCALARTRPDIAQALERACAKAWRVMQVMVPEEANAHQELVTGTILPDWLIGGTPFTSGVVNHTAALPYHRDSGNLRNAWSMMLTMRQQVDGGLLHLPGVNLWLACNDGEVLFFPGQSELHGVTPVRRMGRAAYRFTAVAYVKSQMQKCIGHEEEPGRAAAAATEANRRKVWL